MGGATPELWVVRLGLVIAGLAGWFWTHGSSDSGRGPRQHR